MDFYTHEGVLSLRGTNWVLKLSLVQFCSSDRAVAHAFKLSACHRGGLGPILGNSAQDINWINWQWGQNIM